MALDTRIPLMGQGIDTANPLTKLGAGMAEKQRYDQGVAIQQEQQNYAREQDALNRQRQEKMDSAALESKGIDDQLSRQRLINEQFKSLDDREQSRIKSVSIAAAQVKPYLDSGDVEGALKFAKARQKALHARMGSGENIDDSDTAGFIQMLESGDVESAKHHVDAMLQVGQMVGVLETPKTAEGFTLGSGQKRFDQYGNEIASGPPKTPGAVQTVDPATGEITYTSPKAMPAAALKLQNEALDGLATASNIQADLGTVISQIDQGSLNLGPVNNITSTAMNAAGMSDEKSRNYGSFKTTLEKLRNDSLRLNKGVQTEGDAQRAWNELFQNLNDEKLVSQRLKQIQNINQRAADFKQLEVDNIRSNYGQPQIDYSKYQGGSALEVPETGSIKFLGFE